ncbi:hypothetical protein GCM10027258_65570 [Amycolatopsis stemonae]
MSRTRAIPEESAAEVAAAGSSSPAEAEPLADGETDQATTAGSSSPAEAAPAGAGRLEIAETEVGESRTESEPAEGEAAAEHAPAKTRPGWLRLPALLLAAALLLTGAGVWFTLEARSASSNPAAGNLALTDVGATADVTSAVSLAMNRIFSYSYDKTDVTEKAAAAVLRGDAKTSYDQLFAQVREKAPEQKLVLTSRVSAIAVQELRNGHARLLVFLDQSAVRADNNATDSAAAQLSVTAEHTGDGWVVTELEPR